MTTVFVKKSPWRAPYCRGCFYSNDVLIHYIIGYHRYSVRRFDALFGRVTVLFSPEIDQISQAKLAISRIGQMFSRLVDV